MHSTDTLTKGQIWETVSSASSVYSYASRTGEPGAEKRYERVLKTFPMGTRVKVTKVGKAFVSFKAKADNTTFYMKCHMIDAYEFFKYQCELVHKADNYLNHSK